MRSVLERLWANKAFSIPAAVVVIGFVGWLAFGFFGVHTLFIDDKVDEAAPVFSSGASTPGVDVVTEEILAAMDATMDAEGIPSSVEAEDDEPMSDVPEVLTVVSGDFIGRAHPTRGQAVVLSDGSLQRFLRFEDFETDNGPDLNVYLSNSSADVGNGQFDDDFIDLGDLKGNIGPQNYEIPEDVDLSVYDTVVIWCVRFGVAFGAADLQ